MSPPSPTLRKRFDNSGLPFYDKGRLAPPHAPSQQPRFTRAQSSYSLLSTSNNESHPSLADKFFLPLQPNYTNGPEADDILHNPDPGRDRGSDRGGSMLSSRGLVNLGCLFILAVGSLALFAGYPIASFLTKLTATSSSPLHLGLNATGQVPSIPGNWGLIDKDTPPSARTKVDYVTGATWALVFSDEFNTDGRTFYPGDDPYWEAVDLHYWATGNKEWYDPAAVATRNGSLEITLARRPSHGLEYTGGMVQTWNKFCFTGGLVETAVMLPGFNNVQGLWPAVWAMGNLGRAGYGATLEGMWPYTYDACDLGTTSNQTLDGLPVAALSGNGPDDGGVLSFLPGQRLSRCTCPGESHPGPVHENGEYVGRSAPEIDMFEAQIGGVPRGGMVGAVSQSGQWAPYNYQYNWSTTDNLIIADDTKSVLNGYKGGVYQQATSVVTETRQDAYEFSGYQYSVYGFQYKPGFGDAYISWITDGQLAWTLRQPGMGPDPISEVSDRPVPQEPMYLIANLGISEKFGTVDYDHLVFPSTLRIDWIRVYQEPANINIGCDPPAFPTKAYIKAYEEAYANPNLTTWVNDYKQPMPKNKLLEQC